MAELDEKSLRDVFDRLHAIETNQSNYEKDQAVLRVEFLGVVKAINEKLSDIAEGRNKNCLEHKAEMLAIQTYGQQTRKDFQDYKQAQIEADKSRQALLEGRAKIIWTALVVGIIGFLLQAVPWIIQSAIKELVK